MPVDKRAIYESFRASLPPPLRADRFFKIFYSDICSSRIAVIGLNPGGDPDRPPKSWGASQFYDHGEHDYVDCTYKIAVEMRELLLGSGAASDLKAIRRIPKLNVIFHRSVEWKLLRDKVGARELAREHVAVLLKEISPSLLLIEGFKTMAELEKQQRIDATNVRIVVPGRLKTATLEVPGAFRARAVVLAHPTGSRWSGSHWNTAIETVACELRVQGSPRASETSSPVGPAAIAEPVAPMEWTPVPVAFSPDIVRGDPAMGKYAPARLISPDHKISVVAATNPKKAGSASHVRFQRYKTGMTVSDANSVGIWPEDIRWDLAHGFIELFR